MGAFLRRLRARVKYWNNAEELKKELDAHRLMAIAAFAADGTSERESRWKAARLLGNTAVAREDARAVWLPRLFQQAMQDARYALRGFRRQWAFTIAAVTMLAIGLGVAAGAFTVANGLFFRGWPVPENDQVFRVSARFSPSAGRTDDGLSYGAFKHFEANGQAAEYVAFKPAFINVAPRRGERLPGPTPTGLFVSDNFFQAIRIPLLMGTPPRGTSQTSEATAVISYRLWQQRFEADPQILGRIAWFDGEPSTIVGVTAERFDGLSTAVDVFTPIWTGLRLNKASSVYQAVTSESACCMEIAGRRRAGWSQSQAGQELEVLAAQYRDSIRQPRLSIEVADTAASTQMMARGNLATIGVLAIAAVLFLLVLTCANVGNLFLARNLRRRQEIITRLSLGASRGRPVRQLLIEGLVLSLLAGALALGAASTVPLIVGASSPQAVPAMYAVDWRVILATLSCTALVSLLVSLAPALRTTRVAWRGSAATATVRTSGLRGTLLAVQIAIAIVLILSSALLLRGIQFGLTAPSDFAFQTTTAGTISVPRGTPAERQSAIRAALIAAAVAPSSGVGLADKAPASRSAGIPTSVRMFGENVDYSIALFPMSAAAADVLELRLAEGRWASDTPERNEAVINETLARQVWGERLAVGQTLSLSYDRRSYTITGVTRDSHVISIGPIRPAMHLPVSATSMPVLLAPKTPAGIEAMRRVATAADPNLTPYLVSLPEAARETVGDSLSGAAIASMLGFAALLLAMIGVYGVFSYLVEERRREIGIRMALGAQPRQVGWAMFSATRSALIGGTLAGFLMAFIAAQLLRRFLFGMSPGDPISYVAVGVLLLATALLVTHVPLRRALKANPALTLRAD